jgi:hypothetical protein
MGETVLVRGKELFVFFALSAGQRLVEKLDEAKFNYQAAFWMYRSEFDDWRLHIATSDAETYGVRKVYEGLQVIMTNIQPPLEITLSNITVIESNDEIVRALRKAVLVKKGEPAQFIRRTTIDGVEVEEAYVYRML